MILPWQITQWQQFWRAKQEKHLAHALLLTGAAGMGKMQFAECVARALLCTQGGASYFCHQCHACLQIADKVHPNVLWVHPEEAGHAIKVDQIRAVNEFIQQTSLQGESRLVVIHPADQMNINAANALLKTLEEPSSGAVIMLVSDHAARLPATILSRCQRIHFPQPKAEDVLPWLNQQLTNPSLDPALLLKLAHGAPLCAQQWAQADRLATRQEVFQLLHALKQPQADPCVAAAKIQRLELMPFLDLTLSWVMDLLRLQLGGRSLDLMNSDYAGQLNELQSRTNVEHTVQLMAYLQELRGQVAMGIHLNKLLMTESVLIRWMG